MKAVVLAAGSGSRMGALTATHPKCMLRMYGTTLLERQLEALARGGADDIAVVTGWRAGSWEPTGLRALHNSLWEESTVVDSLAAARGWLADEPFVVAYGDVLFSAATVAALLRSFWPTAVAYDPDWEPKWRKRFGGPLIDAETFRHDAAGRLTEIGARPRDVSEIDGRYAGLIKLTPSWWTFYDELGGRGMELTTMLGELIRSKRLTVGTVAITTPWWEFDQPSDLPLGLPAVRALDDLVKGAP
ncbi:NTP transferase domain-containing protein [Nocardia brasiliensis]|uniref:MobA-like NTP transferase domain-containing protein n=1 Tax=Nocardia brasiliensis (strain ATCC 700358 / HUJEG-1) TaxID=1133849 RepID=K0EXU8_NOCB7|nr:NTP transferase domain-containing protein [Nocardia brasiliensis]AFU04703.1 hypothetical protein O3I_033770 [Nocardia brasiliensis ATCC 700358]